jgi:hypothetical protein
MISTICQKTNGGTINYDKKVFDEKFDQEKYNQNLTLLRQRPKVSFYFLFCF